MTVRDIAHDFPCRSTLAQRAPGDVPFAEMQRELADERTHRAAAYPAMIAKQTMTRADAARHVAIWRAIEADFTAAAAHQDRPGSAQARAASAGNTITWADKLRELRRELALRRNAYPKWIARAAATLTAAEAARKLEALDAIHWCYWHRLFAFTPAGEDPARDLARLHWIAVREAERAKARADRNHHRQPTRTLLDAPAPQSTDRQAAARWRELAQWLAAMPDRPAGFTPASASAYPAGLARHLAHAAAELDRRHEAVTREGERHRFAQVLDVFQWFERACAITLTACPVTRIFNQLPAPPAAEQRAAA